MQMFSNVCVVNNKVHAGKKLKVQCEKCRRYLLDAISFIPDSPHKRFKYAHYQNLVYRTVVGMDAKAFKEKNGVKGNILEFLNESDLKKCMSLFIKVSNSIFTGDSFEDTKNKLSKG